MPGQWRPSLRRRCPSDALSVLALLLRVSGIGIGICAASLILPSQSQVPRRDVPPPRRGGVVAVGVSSDDWSGYHHRHHHHRQQQQQHNPPPTEADRELFSVAPMMGHTNRHYRYFFRLLSQRAHLYSEMVPSAQILAAYGRAREIYLPASGGGGASSRLRAAPDVRPPPPDEVLEVLTRALADPSREYEHASSQNGGNGHLTLHQLLATSSPPSSSSVSESPIVLQLGGRDPSTLAAAAAIASAWGIAAAASGTETDKSPPPYASVNLNCGCPSNAVGGRSGGCALMLTPDLVARGVEAMQESVGEVWRLRREFAGDGIHYQGTGPSPLPSSQPTITVKHRLGVRDAATFDAASDRTNDDGEAFGEASAFVRTVSLSGAVPKFQVHARLGLLGDFGDEKGDNDRRILGSSRGNGQQQRRQQKLWVPGGGDGDSKGTIPPVKIDHKREQNKALRQARQATIKNRDVPPLRPGVVHRLAAEFPGLEFVANGGIDSLDDVQRIGNTAGLYDASLEGRGVVGAMVGRAVINHPCSFAAADERIWGDPPGLARPTRGDVLQKYVKYCKEEEERIADYGASPKQVEALRRRLIAVPFHLFVGEAGSDEFQRRLKKLRDKTRDVRASSILAGAASFVPQDTLEKSVVEFVPWETVPKFEGGLRRGGALQRVVY